MLQLAPIHWGYFNSMAEKPTVGNTIYCTYFDRGFLLKGLALHESLIRYAPDAKLWILAFDKYTEDILKKIKLKGVTVVPLRDFEDKELLAIKLTRQWFEYMWTTTPSWPLYIFDRNKKAKFVVYLDGDEYFFSSVIPAVDEIKSGSMLAVEHRFPKGRENLNEDDGRFNVAFNVFKRDDISFKCLKRWRKQCLDWCYWKLEDGKMGDQLYLNEWPKLYGNKLTISKNIGVNVAPWNVSQYKVTKKNDGVLINGKKLVCYHFHQFQILSRNHYSRVYGYTLSKGVIDYIYKPYETELDKQYMRVKSFDKSFKIIPPSTDGKHLLRLKLAKYLGPIYWRLKSIIGGK